MTMGLTVSILFVSSVFCKNILAILKDPTIKNRIRFCFRVYKIMLESKS